MQWDVVNLAERDGRRPSIWPTTFSGVGRAPTSWRAPSTGSSPSGAPARTGPRGAAKSAAPARSPTSRRAPAGPGRARRKGPHMRGGGIVFGPRPRDHAIDLPKKVREAGAADGAVGEAGRGQADGARQGRTRRSENQGCWPRNWASSAGARR